MEHCIGRELRTKLSAIAGLRERGLVDNPDFSRETVVASCAAASGPRCTTGRPRGCATRAAAGATTPCRRATTKSCGRSGRARAHSFARKGDAAALARRVDGGSEQGVARRTLRELDERGVPGHVAADACHDVNPLYLASRHASRVGESPRPSPPVGVSDAADQRRLPPRPEVPTGLARGGTQGRAGRSEERLANQ
jgi:hypothetical protein